MAKLRIKYYLLEQSFENINYTEIFLSSPFTVYNQKFIMGATIITQIYQIQVYV